VKKKEKKKGYEGKGDRILPDLLLSIKRGKGGEEKKEETIYLIVRKRNGFRLPTSDVETRPGKKRGGGRK